MKMNEIILQKRIQKGLTQEALGKILGVSGPAVHKWEKDSTCPDSTLLPRLARALDTDLNTLLQFQKELSFKEINVFEEKLSKELMEKGIRVAYQLAKEKMQEFPNSEVLALHISIFFMAVSDLSKESSEEKQQIIQEMLQILEKLLESHQVDVASVANQQLFYYQIRKNNLQEAEALLNRLPTKSIDKDSLSLILLRKSQKYEEARKLGETMLLSKSSDILSILDNLIMICKEISPESQTANYFKLKLKELAQLLEIPNGYTIGTDLEEGIAAKDQEATIAALNAFKKQTLDEGWQPSKTRLYRHLGSEKNYQDTKNTSQGIEFLKYFIKNSVETEALDFLKENPEFITFLEELS